MSRGLDKVLYHAVSSYQLLEVLLHRWLFHGEQGAALVLPDFIVENTPSGSGWRDGASLTRWRCSPTCASPTGRKAR